MLLKLKLCVKVCLRNIYKIMLICTLLFVYIYIVINVRNAAIVSKKHPQITPHRIPIRYKVNDDYNTLLDMKNFSFLINPEPCRNTSLLLVIIVSSKPTNFENRKVIRNTWGKPTDFIRVLFLVGSSYKTNTTVAVNQESQLHGDIVKGSFIDSYRNMTYKHAMGLKWITHHCATANFILKTDDDIMVNVFKLRHFLAKELSSSDSKGIIYCQVVSNGQVFRSSTPSKWVVSEEEYHDDYYPQYCSGWAIIYCKDVVPRLLEAVQALPYFWIDDVQISGIAAKQIGVERKPLNGRILARKTKMEYYANISDYLMGPPDCDKNLMMNLWARISSAWSWVRVPSIKQVQTYFRHVLRSLYKM